MVSKAHSPLVIAHRGASGYVPEHTLIAKGIAHAMGADFLEQDVVATKDHQPVVLHDIHIDTVTDVEEKFPDRRRSDGRFYAIDLELEELRSLHVRERVDHRSGRNVFPSRYMGGGSAFRICTLDEEIRFTQNLNRTTGRAAGIYPEIKHPAWHREQGCDLSKIVIDTLRRYGYREKADACFLQCFDEFEVRRIRQELGFNGRLVQLVGSGHDVESGSDFGRMKTAAGLSDLAEVADAIGPKIAAIITWGKDGVSKPTELVEMSHRLGLAVHPWTVRADQLPENCSSLDSLVRGLRHAGVDGMFVDQPDKVIAVLSG